MDLSKFVEFFKGLPLWVRILFALVVIALAVGGAVKGWIAFLDSRNAAFLKERQNWEAEFADVRKTTRIEDGAQKIDSTVDGLVNDAVADDEKCHVGLWFLDFTGNSNSYQLPLGIKLLMETSKDPCVALLKQFALAIQQHQTVSSTPAPRSPAAVALAPSTSQVQARNSIASQIVGSATAEGAAGWVYLGILSSGNQLGTGRTVSTTTLPSENDEVTTIVNLNLRDSIDSSDHIGKIVGVIPVGSTLHVSGPLLFVNHADSITGQVLGRVAWAPVVLQGKASAAPTTPTPAPSPTLQPASYVSADQEGETSGYAFRGETIKVFKVLDSHSTGIYTRNIGSGTVYLDLTPACSNVLNCPPVKNVRVDPVRSSSDPSNDYIYTANTLEHFTFSWRVARPQ